MASNIDIQKKCEWCGKLFIARKTTTRCCSHRCANHAYKERVRKKRVQEFQLKFDEEAKPHSEKEFLIPIEVSAFLGVGTTYQFTNDAQRVVAPRMEKFLMSFPAFQKLAELAIVANALDVVAEPIEEVAIPRLPHNRRNMRFCVPMPLPSRSVHRKRNYSVYSTIPSR